MNAEKEYPTNYPADAVAILDGMSLDGEGKNVELVGSQALRSQIYAGDYDANDFASGTLDHLASQFREMVRRLSKMDVFVGDIKAGVVPEWDVMGDARVRNGVVANYNAETSRSKVRQLRKASIITPTEEKEYLAVLKDTPSPVDLVIAKNTIKPHVVRWTMKEAIEGKKTLQNGSVYTLQDAFASRGSVKVDVVGWIQNNRYTDFAMIYFLTSNGKKLYTPVQFEDEIKESILYYTSTKNYFKVLKREFSLAKFKGETKKMEELSKILNQDLGRIYHILGDIKTLIALFTETQTKPKSLADVRLEIDQFKARMSNIALEPFLKEEHTLLGYINSALKTTSVKQLVGLLTKMEDILTDLLSSASKSFVGKGKFDEDEIEDIEKTHGVIENIINYLINPTYHYLAQRSPVERAAALGLRQLAIDLEHSKKDVVEGKEQKKLDGHEKAIKFQEDRVLNEEPTIKKFFNKELKPIYDVVMSIYDNDRTLTGYFLEYTPEKDLKGPDLYKKAEEYAFANPDRWSKTARHAYLESKAPAGFVVPVSKKLLADERLKADPAEARRRMEQAARDKAKAAEARAVKK